MVPGTDCRPVYKHVQSCAGREAVVLKHVPPSPSESAVEGHPGARRTHKEGPHVVVHSARELEWAHHFVQASQSANRDRHIADWMGAHMITSGKKSFWFLGYHNVSGSFEYKGAHGRHHDCSVLQGGSHE